MRHDVDNRRDRVNRRFALATFGSRGRAVAQIRALLRRERCSISATLRAGA
jgi:hypothetical protein